MRRHKAILIGSPSWPRIGRNAKTRSPGTFFSSGVIGRNTVQQQGATFHISFDDAKRDCVGTYLNTEAKAYLPALEQATAVIDGFESRFGMELLATVDWLLVREGCAPDLDAVMEGIARWPAGATWAARKVKLFDRRSVGIALQRLMTAAI
jgi:hypothetical protein